MERQLQYSGMRPLRPLRVMAVNHTVVARQDARVGDALATAEAYLAPLDAHGWVVSILAMMEVVAVEM